MQLSEETDRQTDRQRTDRQTEDRQTEKWQSGSSMAVFGCGKTKAGCKQMVSATWSSSKWASSTAEQ